MNFISVAEDFIAEGFNPLPLKFDKSPALNIGHPFLYEPINNIEKHFKSCKKIGIACGVVSGGFYAIDFDGHDGRDIEWRYQEFMKVPFIKHLISVGKLTVFQTPSGGYHFYYRHNIEHGSRKIALWEDKKTMIEIRGNGAYVATFPSEGYVYVEGCERAKLDIIEPHELTQVYDICFSYTLAHPDYRDNGKTDKKWAESWTIDSVSGKYNIQNADEAKLLLEEAGWTFIQKRKYDGVELWQRPGKTPDQGISATFGKYLNMFYCFSSSAHPFQENKAYSPFDIYTILKFNGDWKAAKDSLKPKVTTDPAPEDEPNGFPLQVFPDKIQSMIIDLNKSLNFHIDFTAAAVMFTMATINGNKYKLRVKKGWEAPTIFWLACVGFPGTIKTHPIKLITDPLTKLDRSSKVDYDKEMLHYDKDSKKKPNPKPKFKQLLISDYTLEALHSIHDINTRGIGLYKDELKGFLNDMNKYRKGSDEEFWLESFNNGSYIVNRVSKEPVMINHICINLIGTIQHDVLHKVVSQYAGNGLIDRFLFTGSASKVFPISDSDIDEGMVKIWRELVYAMNATYSYLDHEDSEVISMRKEAYEVYKRIDKEYVEIQNADEQSQEIKNYLSKMKTYIPRFALLLGIMDSVCENVEIEVRAEHMEGAKLLADYFVSTAKNLYQNHGVLSEIKEMDSSFRGKLRPERILLLHKAGFRQVDLAKYFGISRQAVSKIITFPDKPFRRGEK